MAGEDNYILILEVRTQHRAIKILANEWQPEKVWSWTRISIFGYRVARNVDDEVEDVVMVPFFVVRDRGAMPDVIEGDPIGQRMY